MRDRQPGPAPAGRIVLHRATGALEPNPYLSAPVTAIAPDPGRVPAMGPVHEIPATGTPAACPLQTHLPLAALPSAVSCAHGHARSVALEWGLPQLAETTELVVSELITNAINASDRLRSVTTPVVRLWLACDRVSIVIHVCDESNDMPVRQDSELYETSGRGLVIVENVSADWGSYRHGNGKVVWARITNDP